MGKELISKKTRYEFREHFVGATLREIEAAFDAADIHCSLDYQPAVSGQRRSLVEQYYHSVDWTKWGDVRKVLTVYENVLIELAQAAEGDGVWPENAAKTRASLLKWLAKDGFELKQGRLAASGESHALTDVSQVATRFDLPELARQIERMKQAVDDDPALAIGTAKELIETTCKSILAERGVATESASEIADLVKQTRKALKLLPDDVPDSAKGAETIRRVLSNLGAIAQGVAELRNLYGTGHGRHGKSGGLSPRHARMVSGAAATLATFLLESHEERN